MVAYGHGVAVRYPMNQLDQKSWNNWNLNQIETIFGGTNNVLDIAIDGRHHRRQRHGIA